MTLSDKEERVSEWMVEIRKVKRGSFAYVILSDAAVSAAAFLSIHPNIHTDVEVEQQQKKFSSVNKILCVCVFSKSVSWFLVFYGFSNAAACMYVCGWMDILGERRERGKMGSWDKYEGY